jgi:thioredoxin-like negative regulator of GroEL
MLAPALSSVSKKLEGRLQVIKIDTDKNPAIATRFNISALPTMVFFKPDGKIVDRIEGLLNEGQLMDRLEYLLKANQT